MTKVQLPFALSAPLNEQQIGRIADLYEIYGILRISVDPGGQKLVVEYDATRFSPEDVEAALALGGFSAGKTGDLEIKNRRGRWHRAFALCYRPAGSRHFICCRTCNYVATRKHL